MVNIAVGLTTSLIGGVAVWVWERSKRTRILHKKARFFGVIPGGECLIVMGNKYNMPGSTSHKEVRAMIEVATLVSELECQVSVEAGDEFRESNDSRTEFCIGGPLSNIRTSGHLAAHIPGFSVRPYSMERDSVAFIIDDRAYRFDHGNQEYALVAKFTPPESTRPVFLICGQSSTTNQAAIYFLKREHRNLARSISSVDKFCILIKVSSIGTYGFHRASLERDVSSVAFTGN